MRDVWIPEAPEHPGLYANESDTWQPPGAKIRTGELQPSTMNANKAKHFDTLEACQKWCDENPVPKFVPREHGFYEAADFAEMTA